MAIKPLYALAAVMLGAGVLVGAPAGPANAASDLREETRQMFNPGEYRRLGCPDEVDQAGLLLGELNSPDGCGDSKNWVWEKVFVDEEGIVVPITEITSCVGPEGAPHPHRAPCPDPSEFAPLWKNCESGWKVGVDQRCLKDCPIGGGSNRVVPEDEPCPAIETGAGSESADCPPGKEKFGDQCLDPCPDGQPHTWGGVCPAPKPPDQPPAAPQYHGCRLWPFEPVRTPIGIPCPWGQVDTGPMP